MFAFYHTTLFVSKFNLYVTDETNADRWSVQDSLGLLGCCGSQEGQMADHQVGLQSP